MKLLVSDRDSDSLGGGRNAASTRVVSRNAVVSCSCVSLAVEELLVVHWQLSQIHRVRPIDWANEWKLKLHSLIVRQCRDIKTPPGQHMIDSHLIGSLIFDDWLLERS